MRAIVYQRLKRSAEMVLAYSGPAHLARRKMRSRRLVFAFHNVVPDLDDGGADRSLHIPLEQFRAYLDVLARTHEIVPLPALVADPSAGTRPRAAITFDDAYHGAISLAVPELARRGMPATFFVAPGLLGRQSFWWDALSAPDGSGPGRFRGHALDTLKGRDAEVRAWACTSGCREVPVAEYARTATEAELHDAVKHAGITLGSHTWSHPNLARIGDTEIRQELTDSLLWLQERFDAAVPWLAYPYGLSSPQAEQAARDAGYDAALRVTGGTIRVRSEELFSLPRFNVAAGLSREGFLLRSAGLFLS